MVNEIFFAVGLPTLLVGWFLLKHALATRYAMQQREIASIGVVCQGRVVAIQRPFMLDDCTRLYFDFVPEGAEHPVRGCHVARQADDSRIHALPTQGTLVTIRYLPHEPQRALIAL